MFLRCDCGYMLTDVACPGQVEHTVLTAHSKESLQDAVDTEVDQNGSVDHWPEHWSAAGAMTSFFCPKCHRLFVGLDAAERTWVFKLERVGIAQNSIGCDSAIGNEDDLIKLGREQSGESPIGQ